MNRPAPGWRMWVAPTTMMLCTLLGYIDRQVLAVLSPTILADTGMTAADYGLAVSAFSVVYTIMNPVFGSVLDHIGLRRGMIIAVIIWTVASMSHAGLNGLIGFALARALLGFGEGAAFPGALRTATEALPANKQSRGLALGYSGASMGALITPPLITPIAQHYGWRFAFLRDGLFGLLWLILWWRVARPPFLPKQAEAARPMKIQWPDLRERRVWIIVSSFGLGGLALGVAAYLSPLYLNRALGLSQTELGHVLWIPMVGWEAGYFFWGWVADRFAANQDRPGPHLCPADDSLAAHGLHDADQLLGRGDRPVHLVDLHRRRLRRHVAARRLAHLSRGPHRDADEGRCVVAARLEAVDHRRRAFEQGG